MMPYAEARPHTMRPELKAEMTPAVPAFVEVLLDRIERLERGRTTPQNSSLPPGSQHLPAKPAPPQGKSKKRRGGQPVFMHRIESVALRATIPGVVIPFYKREARCRSWLQRWQILTFFATRTYLLTTAIQKFQHLVLERLFPIQSPPGEQPRRQWRWDSVISTARNGIAMSPR